VKFCFNFVEEAKEVIIEFIQSKIACLDFFFFLLPTEAGTLKFPPK